MYHHITHPINTHRLSDLFDDVSNYHPLDDTQRVCNTNLIIVKLDTGQTHPEI